VSRYLAMLISETLTLW